MRDLVEVASRSPPATDDEPRDQGREDQHQNDQAHIGQGERRRQRSETQQNRGGADDQNEDDEGHGRGHFFEVSCWMN